MDRMLRFFHGKRHPAEMGGLEVEALLTHLAVAGNVADFRPLEEASPDGRRALRSTGDGDTNA